jgi:DUF4097 and DUF4098 domain-containing protein YvlB
MKKLTALLLLLVSGAAFAATEEQINKTFPVTFGGRLVVDVSFGEIAVTTNDVANEIGVDVRRKTTRKNKGEEEQFLRDNPVVFQHEGNTLIIRARNNSINRRFSNGRNRNEGKYTIRVPAQFNAKLNTSGGGIAVRDLTGEVNANTSGGGLRFTGVHGPLIGDTSGGGIHVVDCEGAIRIDTSGGGIDVAGGGGSLKGDSSGGGVTVKTFNGPVSVATSGGGITIENVKGTVKGSTSGGPINAVLLSPVPGDVTLSTSGGGVTVRIADEAAFNLNAEASGGGVSCDLPVTVQGKIERGHLKGAVNGGGPAVFLRSSGGGIRIKKL